MSISRRSSAPVCDPVLEPLVGGEAVPGLVQDLAAPRATAHITSGAGAGSKPTATPPPVPESHGGAVLGLHVSLDVQLVHRGAATDVASPALLRLTCVLLYESVESVHVREIGLFPETCKSSCLSSLQNDVEKRAERNLYRHLFISVINNYIPVPDPPGASCDSASSCAALCPSSEPASDSLGKRRSCPLQGARS